MNDFKSLPEQVREWLSSSVVTTIISHINQRLGITDRDKMRIIPTLVLRISLSDLPPENFYGEIINKLNLNESTAAILAKEIEEAIFRPIELSLRNQVGIDTKTILSGIGRRFVAPQPAPPVQAPVSAEAKTLADKPVAIRVEPPVRQIPTSPPVPQNRPTFQPIRPPASPAQLGGPIVRLPINTPKNPEVSSD